MENIIKDRKEVVQTATFLSFVLPFILERLDEIEGEPTIYRHHFKQTLKKFKKELEKVLDTIYEGSTIMAASQGIDASNAITEKLELIFEQYKKLIDASTED